MLILTVNFSGETAALEVSTQLNHYDKIEFAMCSTHSNAYIRFAEFSRSVLEKQPFPKAPAFQVLHDHSLAELPKCGAIDGGEPARPQQQAATSGRAAFPFTKRPTRTLHSNSYAQSCQGPA